MNSLRSGQAMSPTTLEMTSNTSIVQKDDVHSTDGENVCNKKKRKMYVCSNCKNYYVSLCGLKKHQQACVQGMYHVCPICERKLVRLDHLEHHIDTHVKGRRYICRECTGPEVCKFKTESSLHNHVRERHKLQLRYANIEVLNHEIFQLESLEEFEKCTKHYKSHRGDTCSRNMI